MTQTQHEKIDQMVPESRTYTHTYCITVVIDYRSKDDRKTTSWFTNTLDYERRMHWSTAENAVLQYFNAKLDMVQSKKLEIK